MTTRAGLTAIRVAHVVTTFGTGAYVVYCYGEAKPYAEQANSILVALLGGFTLVLVAVKGPGTRVEAEAASWARWLFVWGHESWDRVLLMWMFSVFTVLVAHSLGPGALVKRGMHCNDATHLNIDDGRSDLQCQSRLVVWRPFWSDEPRVECIYPHGRRRAARLRESGASCPCVQGGFPQPNERCPKPTTKTAGGRGQPAPSPRAPEVSGEVVPPPSRASRPRTAGRRARAPAAEKPAPGFPESSLERCRSAKGLALDPSDSFFSDLRSASFAVEWRDGIPNVSPNFVEPRDAKQAGLHAARLIKTHLQRAAPQVVDDCVFNILFTR